MANANPESTTKSTTQTTDLELKKVFDQFDSNGDGKISVSELNNVFKSMGTSYTEAELNRVLDEIDIDRDGYINLDEFSAICKSSSSAAEIREAFDLYDQNGNGLISSSEIHKVLNRLGMTCSVEDCVRMIGHVDSDGDGNVNFEEFQKMMSSPELLKNQGSAANAGSGTCVIDIVKRLQMAARMIAAIGPGYIIVKSSSPYGQKVVSMFGHYTGVKAIAGRHTPGTLSNKLQE